MPHQCVRCNKFYDDGATEIIKGCSCGGRLFFYIRKEKLEQAKRVQEEVKLTVKDKKQIEKDVYEIVGEDRTKDEPIVLDLESIRVKKPGQYELDLVHLFKGDPLIVKLEEGKYMIDVPATFDSVRKK